MATLGEFLSPEAGQERRKWLNETLGYYLPPELRGIVGLGAELNPVTNMERAGTAAQRVADPSLGGWDRMAAAGDVAVNMGAVLAPVAGAKLAGTAGVDGANAIVEALTAASPMKGAVGDFMADEFGGVGFKAYHGSPHDFDRFSLDKIGTGEGAQAYGHGLYFAEAEDVAKQYRDQLSRGWKPSEDYMWRGKDAASHYQDAISRGDYGKALVWEQVQLHGTRDAIRQDLLDEIAGGSNQAKAALEFLNTLPDELFAKPSGRMYEVQINADPNDFLDWDKPLSEQPAAVRALASSAPLDGATGPTKAKLRAFQGGTENPAMGIVATGQDLHRALSAYGDNSPAATEAFRSAGIPGIRYLDAGSRGAGEGSRNYVVFDDKLIEILRKYGLAGAVPLGAILGQPQDPMGSYLEAQ